MVIWSRSVLEFHLFLPIFLLLLVSDHLEQEHCILIEVFLGGWIWPRKVNQHLDYMKSLFTWVWHFLPTICCSHIYKSNCKNKQFLLSSSVTKNPDGDILETKKATGDPLLSKQLFFGELEFLHPMVISWKQKELPQIRCWQNYQTFKSLSDWQRYLCVSRRS